MGTGSDKRRHLTVLGLLASITVSGCGSLTPVERQAGPAAALEESKERGRQVQAPLGEVPLPRQTYDSAGVKMRYVPQPNPYTTDSGDVPAEARRLFVVADRALQEGDLRGARKQLQYLTEKYPMLSGPWLKLGVIAEKKEQYGDAIKYYQKAISVNGNNVNAYMALGLLQRRQGYFADAQRTYLEALRVWRDCPEAHLNLAILYDLYVNQPEQAQKHYEAYYFLTGQKDEKAHKWLVEVRQRTGIERSFIDIPPKGVAEVPEKTEGGDAGSEGAG
jgi:tetratricopeptide (TPR) repeat protein